MGAARLGITLNLTNAIPLDPADSADVDAARRVDALWNRAFLEPILLGAYPEDFRSDVAAHGSTTWCSTATSRRSRSRSTSSG